MLAPNITTSPAPKLPPLTLTESSVILSKIPLFPVNEDPIPASLTAAVVLPETTLSETIVLSHVEAEIFTPYPPLSVISDWVILVESAVAVSLMPSEVFASTKQF